MITSICAYYTAKLFKYQYVLRIYPQNIKVISDKEIFPYSQYGTPVSFTALFPLDASKKTATELFPCDSFLQIYIENLSAT